MPQADADASLLKEIQALPVKVIQKRIRVAAARRTLVLLVALIVAGCGAAPTPTPAATSQAGLASTPASPPAPTPGQASPASAAASAPASTPGAASQVPSSAAPGTIAWAPCGAPFECGTVSVPIDYAHPANGSMRLALIRLPATDPAQRIGDLLTDPGGPGDSGVTFLRQAGQTLFSAELRASFDIVGFDPRGVGASQPAVQCVDGPTMDRMIALDPIPTTAAERQAIVSAAKSFDAACVAHSASLLPFMSTVDAAKDMDVIRKALGDAKLTYLGFSYGTFLGSTYANLYPTRVRAFVLDGAVDPTLSFVDSLTQQAESFSANLDAFFSACSTSPSCAFSNGGQPKAAFDALMARISRSPLPALAAGDPRPVTLGVALTGVTAALYDASAWPALAQGLALAQAGDGSILLQLADSYDQRNPNGTFSNIAAANTATTCDDSIVPTSVSFYEQLATTLERKAPWFGANEAYSGLECAFWPFHPAHDPVTPRAAGAPPIVVIGTTGDPATPYQWAVKLAGELQSGVLLTRVGQGHTAYGQSQCIDTAVDAYLISLTVPNSGTRCTS